MEYGCIGEHLGHSFSKEIHNALADYSYELKELSPEELKDFMLNKPFKAINVTIPYKRDVIEYLDYISPEAAEINAVNTIVNKNGKLYGYNTDFFGLKALIDKQSVSLQGKTVAVLGSGGTSNTAFSVAQSMGAKSVIKVSREKRDGYVTYDELYDSYDNTQIIINTTPCGMFPNIGTSAVDVNKFPLLEAVFDAVYNPLCSRLVTDAREKGITAVGGLYMLVSQAAYAVERFIDIPVDTLKVDRIFEKLYKDKMNVVLIGMAGCGKSTVGKALSQKLSKGFVDTDNLIVEKTGEDIPSIFSSKGEAVFRNIEKEVIYNVSKENNKIIATGGGAILNAENIRNLKGNGRVYFINRAIDSIVATPDRPLSSNRQDLEKRFNERYELYISCADVIVDGNGTVEEVAKIIEEDYYGYTCN